jgi:uncharacterized protein (DUF1778 family)
MPNTRFSISTNPEIQSAIRAHADAAGMDVSAYMIAAAVAQMARDDAASAVFASLDARNRSALEQTTDLPEQDLPAFEDLTVEEQLLVQRVVASALGSDSADVA